MCLRSVNIQQLLCSLSHIHSFLDYLKKYVGEALSEGMARVVAQQPADAVDFLGRFLVNYANVKEKELLVRLNVCIHVLLKL